MSDKRRVALDSQNRPPPEYSMRQAQPLRNDGLVILDKFASYYEQDMTI
jgi:hypothetical protein